MYMYTSTITTIMYKQIHGRSTLDFKELRTVYMDHGKRQS